MKISTFTRPDTPPLPLLIAANQIMALLENSSSQFEIETTLAEEIILKSVNSKSCLGCQKEMNILSCDKTAKSLTKTIQKTLSNDFINAEYIECQNDNDDYCRLAISFQYPL